MLLTAKDFPQNTVYMYICPVTFEAPKLELCKVYITTTVLSLLYKLAIIKWGLAP